MSEQNEIAMRRVAEYAAQYIVDEMRTSTLAILKALAAAAPDNSAWRQVEKVGKEYEKAISGPNV